MKSTDDLCEDATAEQERMTSIAGWCFIIIIAAVILGVVYGLGIHVGQKQAELPQMVHVTIRDGEVTPGVPCWAVYNYNGVLVARTAMASKTGLLREFNVDGGPIDYEPLPQPWRWFELDASYSISEP